MKTGPAPDYKAYRVRRSQLLQPLRRAVEYALARMLLLVAERLPLPFLQRLGRGLGALARMLASRQRAIADYQLQMALPGLDQAGRGELIRRCFGQFGMTAVETLAQRRIRAEAERWVRLENEQVLLQAHARGRGVMLITAHTGNWELLPIAMDRLKLHTTVVVRPLHNPRMNELMRGLRRSEYLELAERGTGSSTRQLLSALKNGHVLVMAADVDIKAQGVFVDFFGIPAFTPLAPAQLALRLDSPVLTCFDVRNPDGSHTFHFAEVPRGDDILGADDPVRALTQAITRATEEHVRRYPEQWAWNNRRWKRRPEDPGAPPAAGKTVSGMGTHGKEHRKAANEHDQSGPLP